MSYKDKLNPWCIIRPLSNVQMRVVGRFRRRVDAEGHLKILKRMIPNVPFEIMFDITPEHTDLEDLTPRPLPCKGKGSMNLTSLALQEKRRGRGQPRSEAS
jgi:hypothetical protein